MSNHNELKQESPWYTRPVLFVTDLKRALEFYTVQLGFEISWHEGGGSGTVCQVARATCELILCEDGDRKDRGRLFISLSTDGFAAWRREITERSVPHKTIWWGYDAIQILDPDGNELLFPVSE